MLIKRSHETEGYGYKFLEEFSFHNWLICQKILFTDLQQQWQLWYWPLPSSVMDKFIISLFESNEPIWTKPWPLKWSRAIISIINYTRVRPSSHVKRLRFKKGPLCSPIWAAGNVICFTCASPAVTTRAPRCRRTLCTELHKSRRTQLHSAHKHAGCPPTTHTNLTPTPNVHSRPLPTNVRPRTFGAFLMGNLTMWDQPTPFLWNKPPPTAQTGCRLWTVPLNLGVHKHRQTVEVSKRACESHRHAQSVSQWLWAACGALLPDWHPPLSGVCEGKQTAAFKDNLGNIRTFPDCITAQWIFSNDEVGTF